MSQANRRNLIFVSLSQLGMASSTTFVMSIMPFFIFTISPYSSQETLIWVGMIMGITHIVSAVSSNFWGFLTSRFSPKLLYMRGMFVQTVIFFLMGFTSNLHVLLLLRIIQGAMGGISTLGLIIISASSSRDRISADIGFFQALLSLGFLIGPPFGSLAASAFGYKGAFLSASAVLVGVFVFCYFNVTDVPLQPREEKFMSRGTINRNSVLGWLLCFTVTVQMMFLPSILPQVLEQFQIEKAAALKWAGMIIMLYTATATLGIFFWTRMTRRFGRTRVIMVLVLTGTLFHVLLAFSRGIIDFLVIRMIQTGLIAACIPLVISIFAADLRGGKIGFLNSARFAGNSFGPLIATSVLAFSNLTTMYGVVAALTLLSFASFQLFSKEMKED